MWPWGKTLYMKKRVNTGLEGGVKSGRPQVF
jgi:hypothetical protein